MIRTITATAIRDTDYNALGSYFMVHAILRLNLWDANWKLNLHLSETTTLFWLLYVMRIKR